MKKAAFIAAFFICKSYCSKPRSEIWNVLFRNFQFVISHIFGLQNQYNVI